MLTDEKSSGQDQPSVIRVEMKSPTSSEPDFATSQAQVREHGGYFLSGTTDVPVGEIRLILPTCTARTVSHGYEIPDTPGGFELHGLVSSDKRTTVMAAQNDAPLPVRISIGMYCRRASTTN
jgi:hypothetical protein